MELICSRCGRTFFSWCLEDQDANYPICTKCETMNDFMPFIMSHLADVDPVMRAEYFQCLADDLFDQADVSDFA